MRFEMIDIDELKMYRGVGSFSIHTEELYSNLSDSIQKFGILVPLLVYKDKIVDGKARYLIAQALDINKVPVIVLDYSLHEDIAEIMLTVNFYRNHISGEQNEKV